MNLRVCAFLLIAMFTHSFTSNAGLYKCVDEDGKIEFTDQGCGPKQVEEKSYKLNRNHRDSSEGNIPSKFLDRQAKINRKQKSLFIKKSREVNSYIHKLESEPNGQVRLLLKEFRRANYFAQKGNMAAIQDIPMIQRDLDVARMKIRQFAESTVNKNPKWKIQQDRIDSEQKILDISIDRWKLETSN